MKRVVILLEIGEEYGILHKMSVEPKNSKVQGKSSSHPLVKEEGKKEREGGYTQ